MAAWYGAACIAKGSAINLKYLTCAPSAKSSWANTPSTSNTKTRCSAVPDSLTACASTLRTMRNSPVVQKRGAEQSAPFFCTKRTDLVRRNRGDLRSVFWLQRADFSQLKKRDKKIISHGATEPRRGNEERSGGLIVLRLIGRFRSLVQWSRFRGWVERPRLAL